jgi:hypothetical protein
MKEVSLFEVGPYYLGECAYLRKYGVQFLALFEILFLIDNIVDTGISFLRNYRPIYEQETTNYNTIFYLILRNEWLACFYAEIECS